MAHETSLAGHLGVSKTYNKILNHIIDCVGPLPKTKSGSEFLLAVMCASTRFPEAIL